ncbi:DUF192 domain-containing protein [Candidatus Nitrosocosmicus hydrocola]|uniref:DUF192 domain-containing protein n=1 Tax=Candidatus Nitrosocosmicus hydrocola TaxID=1826872 RepID=UPI001E62A77A|nr:DUF192 domain-containing protein [Candidatus Nitrosocosmicus hydrocola]
MILSFTLLLISCCIVSEATFSLALDKLVSGDSSIDNVNATSLVQVNNMTLGVILATEPSEQSKGLAIKDSMNEKEGMLFIFKNPQKHSFWMKDMKFPIDIIWADPTGKIVHIEKNLQPCVFLLPCTSYSPKSDSLYVLEVVSNFTNKYDVKIGDQILSDSISSNNK